MTTTVRLLLFIFCAGAKEPLSLKSLFLVRSRERIRVCALPRLGSLLLCSAPHGRSAPLWRSADTSTSRRTLTLTVPLLERQDTSTLFVRGNFCGQDQTFSQPMLLQTCYITEPEVKICSRIFLALYLFYRLDIKYIHYTVYTKDVVCSLLVVTWQVPAQPGHAQQYLTDTHCEY